MAGNRCLATRQAVAQAIAGVVEVTGIATIWAFDDDSSHCRSLPSIRRTHRQYIHSSRSNLNLRRAAAVARLCRVERISSRPSMMR